MKESQNTATKSHDAELNYFIQSPRTAYGLRLRDAVSHAVEQHLIEEGAGQSKANFIEQSLIQRLGGVGGVAGLLKRYVERLNRKERAIDALNPKLWEINENFELVQDKGATY